MKNLNLIKLLVLVGVFIASINTAWGHTSRALTSPNSVHLVGTMNNWGNSDWDNIKDQWALSKVGNDGNHWIGYFLIKGSSSNYEFKLRVNDNTYSGDYSTNYTYHSSYTGGWVTQNDFTSDRNNSYITPLTTSTDTYIGVTVEFYAKYGNNNDGGYLRVQQKQYGTSLFTNGQTLYLDAEGMTTDARFAVVFLRGDGGCQNWRDMTQIGSTNVYTVDVPEDNVPGVIFCRMNGSQSANTFDNRWNQSNDLVPNSYNCYDFSQFSGTNHFDGSWAYNMYKFAYKKGVNGTGTEYTDYQKSGQSIDLRGAIFTRDAYTQTAWNTSSSGSGGTSYTLSASHTASADLTLYPTWTPVTYSVTINSNNSSMGTLKIDDSSQSFGSAYTIGVTNKITVTPNAGYYFTGWSDMPAGMHKVSDATTINGGDAYFYADGTGKTITASFAPMWAVVGGNSSSSDGSDAMGDWSTTANEIQNITTPGGKTTGYVDITLEANTTYQFKMYNNSLSGTPAEKYYSYNGESKQMTYDDNEAWTLYTGNNNSKIVTAGKGSYKFTWNSTDHELTVDFPTSYTVTFGYGTGGSTVTASGSVSGSITTGQYVAGGENVTFTQSAAPGYTFKEWNTQADGNGDPLGTSDSYTISSISANAAVYAIYTPNVYRVRFDLNGGNSFSANGSSSEDGTGKYIDVTYDASLAGLTPPRPVKNGYVFKCWSTDPDLWEGKYLWTEWPLESGTLTWCNAGTNSDYISSTTTWKKADDITLYAHYMDPTFLKVKFEPEHAMPESDMTATISFNSAIGDPEGFYTLCCKLSTKSGTVLQAQPTITQDGENPFVFRFKAPSSPGDYALQVKLFPGTDNVCGGNSPIATIEGGDLNSFDVEEMNPITITYECGGVELRESTTIYATWNNRATVTAPTIAGMNFDHWEYTNCTIDGGTAGRYEEPEATFYAFTTGSAKAVYTQGSLFFKDTKGWGEGNIYIYFYSSNYWHTKSNANDPEGTGSATSSDYSPYNGYFHSGPFLMTKLEGTDDVYYYNGEAPTYAAVAFANESMENYQFFANTTKACEVVYVNAFDADKPMIVPVGEGADWNKGYAHYYSHDLAPLLQDWGATVRTNLNWTDVSHKLKSAKMGDLSFSTTIYFDRKSYNYQWAVWNKSESRYSVNKVGETLHTINYNSPITNTLTTSSDNMLVKTNLPGEYTFTITYSTETTASETHDGAATTDGLWKHATVTVTYPVNVGDYRLVYDDANLNPHPSDIISKKNDGEQIVNMFYNPNATPVMKVQSCTAVATDKGDDVDPITWSSPTTLSLSSFSSVLTDTCVYNFTVTQDASGLNPAISQVEKYTGRFYVRTDSVNDDHWNYKNSKDAHTMTYSEWSATKMEDTDMRFSHYYVNDIHGSNEHKGNIRFTVATDYSEAICDTVFNGDADGKWKDYFHSELLTTTANVRFTYDQKRNKVWRAYTEGPENPWYMVLNGNHIYKSTGGEKGTSSDTLRFVDMNNWVYQVDAYADVNSYIKLTAKINGNTNYLRGKEGNGTDGTAYTEDDGVLLIGGSGDAQHMRITYDFKTDRMMTSWLPSGPVDSELDINADIMLIRTHQDGASSVTFAEGGLLKDVQTAYGVMEFRKSYINDYSLSRYERNLYWISFPFDVNLSDVFGFGKYGEHWIIEYYDGKGRAQKGYWAESEPNWKFVTEEVKDEFVLKANEGYILALALSNMGEYSDIWANSVTSVYLYFPSAKEIGSLADVSSVTVELDTVGYKCNITRDSRNIKDSYWRCIGAPSFAQSTRTGLPTTAPANWETKVPYVYTWNSTNNSLAITSSSSVDFLAMHSYLIQYPDNKMEWTDVTNVPAGVVRRKIEGNEASFYEWNLNLLRNGEHMDHTYVRLTNDENATDGYDFGNDLSKEFNSGSNIYTFVDGVEVAGNVKPISTQTTVVPVGVKIATDGDYTFAMPEGTNGTGIVLIDNIAGARTNLALEDYTVNLTAGTFNERFILEISPIAQAPTDVEAISDEGLEIRKVMVDGILYIVKDGVVFDARGNRVK